jgi:hypothetical protein
MTKLVEKLGRILIVLLVALVVAQFIYADEVKTKRVEKFVNKLNHGAAATMCDMSFSCHDPKSDKPILVVKALIQCLECNDCLIQMNTFLGDSFLLISEVWFKNFGSYRMNITNQDGKLVFIINCKHKLLRPRPLPEDYS